MEDQKELHLLDLHPKMLKVQQLNLVDQSTWEEHWLLKKLSQENKELQEVHQQVKVQHASLETWVFTPQKIHCTQSLKIVEKLRKLELLKTKMERYFINLIFSQEDLAMLSSLIMLQLKRGLLKQDQMLKEEQSELILLNQTKDQVVIEEEEEVLAEEETEEAEEASVEEAVTEVAAEAEEVSEAEEEEET